MNRVSFTLILATLTFLLAGCSSPMQKTLAQYPKWKERSQSMAAKHNSDGSGLAWQPFPDLDNPLHHEIWNTLRKNGRIGLGCGCICKYDACYLVIVPDPMDEEYLSSFCFPPHPYVANADYSAAYTHYRSNRQTTNVVAIVRRLLAVEGFECFIINDANDIPHAEYSKDHPDVPFKDMLLAKGINITPPTLKYNEYNVYVYMPCGGQIFRYELQYYNGIIGHPSRYCIASEIGDFYGIY